MPSFSRALHMALTVRDMGVSAVTGNVCAVG